MKGVKKSVFFICLVLGMAGAFPGTGLAEHPAKVQLEGSIHQILSVLRDPALKPPDQQAVRREKLRQVAAGRFDYAKMTQLSLGRYWKDRTPEEQDEFIRLFSKLLEDTYMGKIETYTDEKVVFLGERTAKKKAQIDTKIVTDTVEIPINYRMYQKTDTNWMVYDLVIEGVSLIGNYRSQFGQILDSHSYQELVQKLKEK